MTPLKQIQLELGAGAVLLAVGLTCLGMALFSNGTAAVTEPADTDRTSQVDEPVPQRAQRFRLGYDDMTRRWTVAPEGGVTQPLTDILPPPEQRLPSGFVSVAQVRQTLRKQIADLGRELSDAERAELAQLQLGGEPLFSGDAWPRPTVTADSSPQTETIAPLSPADRPPPVPAHQVPAAFDPTTTSFRRNLETWRAGILHQVNANRGTAGVVNLLYRKTSGQVMRVRMAAGARKRMLDDDFGSQPIDAAIYLQYLAVEHGQNIVVDGAFGKNSLNAWADVLDQRLEWRAAASTYIAFLQDYFRKSGGGWLIPLSLQPGTTEFDQQMTRWHSRIRSALPQSAGDQNSIRFQPDLGQVQLTLVINGAAVKRLSADDFGKKNSDRNIYLQYLANRFGETLSIDGQVGPGSRTALGQVLQGPFRRSENLAQTYQTLLKR